MSDDDTYDLTDPGDDRPGLDDIDDDFDDDEDFDDLEDATPEEVDFVLALYREDGEPQAVALGKDLANDLDELVAELRRYPGDAGVLGMVCIDGEFFVLVRVRGRNVQVLLSDLSAATDFPLARDIVDYLGEEVDDDDDAEPLGDLGMLEDLGVSEFELEQLASNYDDDADEVCQDIVDKLKLGEVFAEVLD